MFWLFHIGSEEERRPLDYTTRWFLSLSHFYKSHFHFILFLLVEKCIVTRKVFGQENMCWLYHHALDALAYWLGLRLNLRLWIVFAFKAGIIRCFHIYFSLLLWKIFTLIWFQGSEKCSKSLLAHVHIFDHNKGIGDAGSTADFRMLWSAMVCLGLL